MFKLVKNLLFIALCFAGYLWIRKESIAEHWLSDRLHTQVSIDRVIPTTSGIKFRHICIHNPIFSEHFPYAAEIESIEIKGSFLSLLLAKRYDISKIRICGATFSTFPYEKSPLKTNWSFLWKHFLQNENSVGIPVSIKECLFEHTRIHGLRTNKEVPLTRVPFMTFYGNPYLLPSFDVAIQLLLYLAVEESLYLANLPGDIVKPLSKQAHNYFSSAHSAALDENHYKATEDIIGFIKALVFR